MKTSRRTTARNRRTASIRPITAPTITPVLSLLDSGSEVSSVGGVSEGVDCVGELVTMTEDGDWGGVVLGLGCWRMD